MSKDYVNIDFQGCIPKGNRVDNANGNNVVDCVDELELSCNWEAESNLGSVKGRLRDSVECWPQK